jgi:hypothetical protein
VRLRNLQEYPYVCGNCHTLSMASVPIIVKRALVVVLLGFGIIQALDGPGAWRAVGTVGTSTELESTVGFYSRSRLPGSPPAWREQLLAGFCKLHPKAILNTSV